MTPKLSIIIPVYNVEIYLSHCLESILNQIQTDIEIILIDDGSPDNCPAMCDEYSNKYSFIKVIHKDNEGLSCARNTGLDIASGEYIWFVDSDDFLVDGAIHTVLHSISNNKSVEVFSSGLIWFYESTGKSIPEKMDYGRIFNGNGEYLFKGGKPGASQRFISQRDFLLNNNLYFQPGLLHEDGVWGYTMLYLASTVKVIDIPIYVYRIRNSGSIMSSIKIKSAYDLVIGHKYLIEFMDRHIAIEDKRKYRILIWGMLRAIENFCWPLYHTREFERFLGDNYAYIKKERFELIKTNPFRLKSYIYLLHPYTRMKILRLLGIKRYIN